mmetsp:Transcript_25370/g.43835  ORF Transcript_25370/g.43835 Transcript_25370/m.43835 type:complete len:107 (+) Transcript_25370:508-828(+)
MLTCKLLVEIEQEKKRQEEIDLREKKRALEQEEEMKKKMKFEQDKEKEWEESRENRVDSWRSFVHSKGSLKKAKAGKMGMKPPSLKLEQRPEGDKDKAKDKDKLGK